jgi:quercetin dioxygenase-like cupin family protein
MRLRFERRLLLVAGLAGAVGLGGGVALGRTSYPPLDVLFSGSETVLGHAFAYPGGKPVVTAALVTMVPGQETGWHQHDAPEFAWILDGELTVDYGRDGDRVYHKDDAFVEAFRSLHNGRNSGTGNVRLLAVFMGAEGVENTVMQAE